MSLFKYFNKAKSSSNPSTSSVQANISGEVQTTSKRAHEDVNDVDELQPTSKRNLNETDPYIDLCFDVPSSSNPINVDLSNIVTDPGLRKQIKDYHPNERDLIRRAYLLQGPCQPKNHTFPQKLMGKYNRKFKKEWFGRFGSWLEYSIKKDAVFCLYCFLFRLDRGNQGGGKIFVEKGFDNWEKIHKLQKHVGGVNSAHNRAYMMAQNLLIQDQHIETVISRKSDQARSEYRVHLAGVIDVIRFLLRQGLAFRGHDESKTSSSRGNFLELLKYTSDHNEAIKNVFQNASENLKLTSPDIQKDLVNACAVETMNVIRQNQGDALFAILIDEAHDVSIKEQMAIVLRYVDTTGSVIERFYGVVHVKDTSAISLKKAIDEFFSKHRFSITRLRGQGYDGASNMRGEFNGLKALILKENKSAIYVHCFAHQLQLALVAVAKNHEDIALLFNIVSNVVNIVGASCKRRDALREKKALRVMEAFGKGEIQSGKGLNQETSLKRSGDTRWSSHYGTLLNMILMFPSVIDVLEDIVEDGRNSEQRGEASALMDQMQSFTFIFSMYLMKSILGITNDLSKALQRENQDIVNAMALVEVCKTRLQTMRDSGWESFLNEVSVVCGKYSVDVPNMEDKFVARGRSRRGVGEVTNLHYYCYKLFYGCIDWQTQELGNRFNEVNTELLLCMACLDPRDSFVSFDKQKLLRFAEFYPADFSAMELMTYIIDLRANFNSLEVNGIGGLAKRMVETRKNIVYPLVYLLITLALTLPVATASVERAFSAMNIVKNRLRNRMGDQWMNDSLITYIEKDAFDGVDKESIIQRFQSMGPRRGQL
ncbi:hypothetical protein AQUCO_08100010v1 [Aquilegia coerulea]|uniref:TTF-type domain-containing protein n=1 Tax=Aquilegia coerulea TaxID=218851 RepID=A0A2G5C7K0_AQUCA|nr:hypothetical protein AQUCO_08100010v1 [Aquilegia coerulea]